MRKRVIVVIGVLNSTRSCHFSQGPFRNRRRMSNYVQRRESYRCRSCVGPEWRLDKSTVFRGLIFTITAAVANLLELVARLVQELVRFWSAFDCTRFIAMRAQRHLIPGDGAEQLAPKLAAALLAPLVAYLRGVLAHGID